MEQITVKELLAAGVHFGHQTKRWNPKMQQYIFGEREGIHIIDLQKTHQKLLVAMNFLKSIAEKGEDILFVGTKRQIKQIVEEEAGRCGVFYISNRWPGGLLTNFETIRQSMKQYNNLQGIETDERKNQYTKKEILKFVRIRQKIEKTLGGIVSMNRLPSVLCIIDVNKEVLSVKEANSLGIPVVGVVDTNANPEPIKYPVPGNDDAMRSVKTLLSCFADAVLEGKRVFEETHPAKEVSSSIEETKHSANIEEEITEEKAKKPFFKKSPYRWKEKQDRKNKTKI
ncbi:30S ribosomal protein S2 [bacterium Unc6]|nr:30S ribosomal protein S2 [bacterium Unc6]